MTEMPNMKVSLWIDTPDGHKLSVDLKIPADQLDMVADEFAVVHLMPAFEMMQREIRRRRALVVASDADAAA